MITGGVDDYGRPLVKVTVIHPISKQSIEIEAWVDTGFTGGLTLTPDQVKSLTLPSGLDVFITIANGATVQTTTASCIVEWFGRQRSIDALVSPGKFALIGLHFLEDHELVINYPNRTVTITLVAQP